VPKDDTDRRVIVDCSYGNTESVNDGIPQRFFFGEPLRLCYPRHDEFVSLIVKFGQKCHIWKCDLSRTFRQLHVDPHDLHLLGCKWKGKHYIGNRLIFGMRSSPQACQQTTNAISYMLYSANISLVNYVDDFGGVSKSESSYFDYQYMLDLLNNLGLDVNFGKCVKPSTEMVFWGKLYNTESMTVCIPEEKIKETIDLLHWFEYRKRQLQQLIGKLAFIAECVRSGRLFISRMLDTLRKYKCNFDKIRLTLEFRKDVQWWLQFLRIYNGLSLVPDLDRSEPDSVISTDACLKGLGGINFITNQ
jgi:hypothetical protein